MYYLNYSVQKMDNLVFALKIDGYNKESIFRALPDGLFHCIKPGQTVVIKPNWVLQHHQTHEDEWEQIITHPDVITAVFEKIITFLSGSGKIIIIDGPELNANFDLILQHYPVSYWRNLASENNIELEIIDLRDQLYIQDGNVTLKKVNLSGDPRGNIVVNLENDLSEFFQHQKSQKGYFGAGPDIDEVNRAHDGKVNLYSVSRSVIEADVFVNIPKLKTHKKAGLTSSLKNLVGINTYRNFLPHYSLGTKEEGGDQFPFNNLISQIEGGIGPFINRKFLINLRIARFLSPMITLGKIIFGDNNKTIRSGAWYGNDTIWRTILDINKVLLYADTNGKMRDYNKKNCKKYISIVDAIISGEDDGPKKPTSIPLNYIFCGSNPVSVDAVCALFMGFSPEKIPSIWNAFKVKKYPLVDFTFEDIIIKVDDSEFNIESLPDGYIKRFVPQRGWQNHIES
jgi:uncharacterized protein (DUF362 family)